MHFELHKRRAASIVFAGVAAGELLAIYVMYKVMDQVSTTQLLKNWLVQQLLLQL